jgi:hypothetical protein
MTGKPHGEGGTSSGLEGWGRFAQTKSSKEGLLGGGKSEQKPYRWK